MCEPFECCLMVAFKINNKIDNFIIICESQICESQIVIIILTNTRVRGFWIYPCYCEILAEAAYKIKTRVRGIKYILKIKE